MILFHPKLSKLGRVTLIDINQGKISTLYHIESFLYHPPFAYKCPLNKILCYIKFILLLFRPSKHLSKTTYINQFIALLVLSTLAMLCTVSFAKAKFSFPCESVLVMCSRTLHGKSQFLYNFLMREKSGVWNNIT